MTARQESHILYRRFAIVTLVVALIGILLAELIAATQFKASDFVVHDRQQQWRQQVEPAGCDKTTRLCALEMTGLTIA